MKKDILNTFREKLYECNKHVEKINIAKKYLGDYFPLTSSEYLKIDIIPSSFIDQLIFRFSKLQDTMGDSLFPEILVLGEEEVKRKTFIDILNRLEELDILEKNKWLLLRKIIKPIKMKSIRLFD